MSQHWLSIVVPVRNGTKTLPRLLRALDTFAKQDGVEVLFVDDASTDDTANHIRDHGYDVLSLAVQGGAARARNEGVRTTSAPWILFLDADTIPPPNTLDRVRANFSRSDAVGMVGVYAPRPANPGFWPEYKALQAESYHHQTNVEDITFLWGGMCAVKRNVLLEAGGFNESAYQGADLEDVDLGRRITRYGKIFLDREFVVGHHYPDTLKGNFKNHFHRGRLWVEIYLGSGEFENYVCTPGMALSRFVLLAAPLFVALGCITDLSALWILGVFCGAAYAALTRQFLLIALQRMGCWFAARVIAAEFILSAALVVAIPPAIYTVLTGRTRASSQGPGTQTGSSG